MTKNWDFSLSSPVMSSPSVSSAGVTTDLTNCDREPIHIPASIQPHGMLIAARNSDLRIAHVSENSLDFLGVAPAYLLERTLPEVLGSAAVAAILQALGGEQYFPTCILTFDFPVSGSMRFDVVANRAGDFLCIEIERGIEARRSDLLSARMDRIVRRLKRLNTLEDLCALVPPLIRELTGYDRVMIYRFDPDGHGEVIGEAKDPALEPFLGLHYPARDIPQQARRLYLMQRIRTIVDVGYTPVRLITHPDLAADKPLDMTYCGLRSVSEIHVEYLQNMGVGASLGMSLIHHDELWGMVICHHRTKKHPTHEVRVLCDSIGQLVSLLLSTTLLAEDESKRVEKKLRLDALSLAIDYQDSMGQQKPIEDSLAEEAEALLDLVKADGALIRLGGQTRLVGITPPLAEAASLMSVLQSRLVEGVAASNEVGVLLPAFAHLAATASGALSVHFFDEPHNNAESNGIIWFRGEVARTVNWGGNPDAAKELSEESMRLSPRKSFALWKQVQRGRSLPWRRGQIGAALGLQQIVIKALLQRATTALLLRAEVDLTRISNYDPITGLANRRAFIERLTQREMSRNTEPAALLFLDLDDFDAVNEALGQADADEILKQIGARLRSSAGAEHMVARLSADHFAILCEDVDLVDAAKLANSILVGFTEPFDVQRTALNITTSIGVAPVIHTAVPDPTHALRVADSAMFIAKQKGGNQVVVVQNGQHAKALRLEIAEDVAARQLAARQLEAAYAQLDSMMNSTSDGVLRIGHDWTIRFGNRKAFQELAGLKVGFKFWDCFPQLLNSSSEQHLRTAMEDRIETRYESNNILGSEWYRVHVFPEEDGIGIFFSNCTLEKTTLSKLELEQVLREKRIEALSHMAGGLAHEISNPLAIIHGRASDLKSFAERNSVVPSAEVVKACESIVATSDRAIRILRGLRGFAREAGQDPMELASVYEIIDQSVELQQDRFDRQNVEIRTVIQPEIPLLRCREAQVGQILTNLLNNAFDEIVAAKCEERWILLEAEVEGEELRIDVTDSGPGIAEKLKPHLMEPFFTTKELGTGMGVGLSLSRAIAQDHGGTLTLRKDTQHTCFRLVLPMQSASADGVRQQEVPHAT